ncbi:MAG: hypothetical protein WCV73_04300 [Patescibacteria group bacterium]
MTKINPYYRYFSKDGIRAEILKKVISSIPAKTKIYVIGGGARNAIYYELFKKSLPQRDFDLLLIGDLKKFTDTLRKKYGFTYGKINRKHDVVLKKKLIPKPKIVTDYLVLDIHQNTEPSILKNLQDNAAFSINGFAIPLKNYLDKKIKKHLIALPRAINDLRNHRLRLNSIKFQKHPGNLFACLRFMSLNFTPPPKKEVALLLEQLPHLEKWRFARNVKKVFNYVGGEKRARQLVKKLGIKIDIFDFNKLKVLKK